VPSQLLTLVVLRREAVEVCDDTAVRLLLATAMASVATALGFIAAAIIANASFFGAWASPGLMVGAGIASGAAGASVGLAIAAINSYVDCLKEHGLIGSQCAGQLRNVLTALGALSALLLGQAAACAGAAGVAWIPWAGATAMGIIAGTLILQGAVIPTALIFLDGLRTCLPPTRKNPTGFLARLGDLFPFFGFRRPLLQTRTGDM